jgi:hypothetical protein
LGVRGADAAYQQALAKRVKEEGEHNDMANMDSARLRAIVNDPNSNQFERAAAVQALANLSQATQTDLNNMRTTFGETSQVFRQLQAKVKSYDPVAAFTDQLGNLNEGQLTNHMRSNQFDYTKLKGDSATNARLLELGLSSGDVSVKDIETQRGKLSQADAGNLSTRLTAIANDARYNDHGNQLHRNIQMAALAQGGAFSAQAGGNQAMRQALMRESSDETWKRFNDPTMAADPTFLQDFENNISSGKLAQVMPAMRNRQSAKIIMDAMRGSTTHGAYINSNPALQGLHRT